MSTGRKCINPSCTIYRSGNALKNECCKKCAYNVEDIDFSNSSSLSIQNTSKKSNPLKYVLLTFIAIISISIIIFSIKLLNNKDNANNSKDLLSTIDNGEIVMEIQGSNTIGAVLMPELIEKFLNSKGAKNITKDTSVEEETVITFNLGNTDKNYIITIKAHGSSTAFEGLKSSECDLGMASRKIKTEELEELNSLDLGDFSSSNSEHILGLDGIAVIVNNSNSINKLTVSQLNDIYTGKITNWKDLGGKDAKIEVLSRDENSGTHDTFESLVLGDDDWLKEVSEYSDSQKLTDDVSNNENSIGYIGVPYIQNSKPVEILDENSTGFMPSTFNIASEDYALTRRLYLYTTENNENEYVNELLEYALSDEGQNIVSECEFVSQNIEINKNIGIDDIKDSEWENEKNKSKYLELANNTLGRLSINFRFNFGESTIDNKGLNDVKRVVELLNSGKYLEYNITLVGFTDNIGDYNENLGLSVERAEFVKSEIIKENKALENRIKVLGASSEMPVTTNETDEGKNKNRRVEVWLTAD
jgi:phosphate transport system substrate-binding protein